MVLDMEAGIILLDMVEVMAEEVATVEGMEVAVVEADIAAVVEVVEAVVAVAVGPVVVDLVGEVDMGQVVESSGYVPSTSKISHITNPRKRSKQDIYYV